jgi:hypothetical protein
VDKPVSLEQLPSAIRSLLIPTPPTLTAESQLPQSVRELLGSLSGAFTPRITTQPSLSGGLSVAAENNLDPQIKYQWLRNGLPISTGTESSLRRAGLAGGTYQVRASNTVSGTNSVNVVIPDNGHEVVFVPNTGALFSKYETTVGQWKAFVEETGWNKSDAWKTPMNLRTQEEMGQTDFEPVVCINASDATDYCGWLSQKTGGKWRLPKAEEWGGIIGERLYPWGNYYPPLSTDGNFYGLSNEYDGFQHTAPVGSYGSIRSIYDLDGNVWEWVSGGTFGSLFELRGGAYDTDNGQTSILQTTAKHREEPDLRHPAIGFRVVRDWLNEGLVAYYPFNGNATDDSGNGLNGVVKGSALLGTDRFGSTSGYTFPSAGDMLILPIGHSNFESDFTLSVWVKPTGRSHDYAQIVSGENSFLQLPLYGPIYASNGSGWFGKAGFYRYNKSLDGIYGALNSQTELRIGEWSHVLVTVKGNQSCFYLNGARKDVSSTDFNFTGITGGSLYVGGNPEYSDLENFRWEGVIDDIRIYNRALTEQEVKALYSMEKPETETIST